MTYHWSPDLPLERGNKKKRKGCIGLKVKCVCVCVFVHTVHWLNAPKRLSDLQTRQRGSIPVNLYPLYGIHILFTECVIFCFFCFFVLYIVTQNSLQSIIYYSSIISDHVYSWKSYWVLNIRPVQPIKTVMVIKVINGDLNLIKNILPCVWVIHCWDIVRATMDQVCWSKCFILASNWIEIHFLIEFI